MRFNVCLFILSGLVSLGLGSAVPCCTGKTEHGTHFDVIIVGGGPSGLAALGSFGRVHRNALLIDSGEYRNAETRHMHDVLGFDGVTPAYYRYSARMQIAEYDSVLMKNGTVTRIIPQTGGESFVVEAIMAGDGDSDPVSFSAKRIILATGLVDEVPSTPGFREAWAKGVFWCPWCDGNEYAEQPLGIVAPLGSVAKLAEEILNLNDDVIAFTNGTDTPENREIAEKNSPNWEGWFDKFNYTVDNRMISQLVRIQHPDTAAKEPSIPTTPEHDLFSIEFTTGESVERTAFLTSFPNRQRSDLGLQLGVAVEKQRMVIDSEKGGITNVTGVYAIGDADSDKATNVYYALYSGKRASVNCHLSLSAEEVQAVISDPDNEDESGAINKIKRSQPMTFDEAWKRMADDDEDITSPRAFISRIERSAVAQTNNVKSESMLPSGLSHNSVISK